MAVVDFSNVEYRFRYGLKKDLDATSIRERSFNIAYDTGELFVDIMGRRVPINSKLIAMDTEKQIRAQVDPEEYIYYAKDTCNLLYYHGLEEGWKICNREVVLFSERAQKDRYGDDIDLTYATKNELAHTDQEIRAVIASMHSFEIEIFESIDDLPDPGETHTLYFVADHTSEDPNTGETIVHYAQYIWIHIYDEEFDTHVYERVGVTTPDMAFYYTKAEIDAFLAEMDFGEERA